MNDGSGRDINHRHLDGYEDASHILESVKAREAPFIGHAWIPGVAQEWGLPQTTGGTTRSRQATKR